MTAKSLARLNGFLINRIETMVNRRLARGSIKTEAARSQAGRLLQVMRRHPARAPVRLDEAGTVHAAIKAELVAAGVEGDDALDLDACAQGWASLASRGLVPFSPPKLSSKK